MQLTLDHSYEDNQVRNVKTGLALTFPDLAPNVAGDQQHVQGSETQRFEYAYPYFPLFF